MKKFEEAKIEITKFAVEDVVTASGTNSGDTGSMGDED